MASPKGDGRVLVGLRDKRRITRFYSSSSAKKRVQQPALLMLFCRSFASNFSFTRFRQHPNREKTNKKLELHALHQKVSLTDRKIGGLLLLGSKYALSARDARRQTQSISDHSLLLRLERKEMPAAGLKALGCRNHSEGIGVN